MSASSIVVIGHTGFIGRPLFRELGAQAPGSPLIGVSYPDIDLRDASCGAVLAKHFIPGATVVLCAAQKRQSGDTLDNLSENLAMLTNVCRALQDHPVRRVVYFSSAAVYGEEVENLAITEESPVTPQSFYGIGKYTGEGMLRKTCSARGSSLLVVRPPLAYGPGDASSSYGPAGFARAAVRGEAITLWGGGDERRGLIYVEDLARAVARLSLLAWSGVVNVADQGGPTFREMLDVVLGCAAAKPEISSRPRSKQKVDHGFDNKLLRSLLPDFRFTSLAEGVKRTVEAEREVMAR